MDFLALVLVFKKYCIKKYCIKTLFILMAELFGTPLNFTQGVSVSLATS